MSWEMWIECVSPQYLEMGQIQKLVENIPTKARSVSSTFTIPSIWDSNSKHWASLNSALEYKFPKEKPQPQEVLDFQETRGSG